MKVKQPQIGSNSSKGKLNSKDQEVTVRKQEVKQQRYKVTVITQDMKQQQTEINSNKTGSETAKNRK